MIDLKFSNWGKVLIGQVFREFCDNDVTSLELLPALNNVIRIIKTGDVQTGVFTVINILQRSEDTEHQLRALLILEHVIHHGLMPQNKLLALYTKVSDKLTQSSCNKVANKATKLSCILNHTNSASWWNIINKIHALSKP